MSAPHAAHVVETLELERRQSGHSQRDMRLGRLAERGTKANLALEGCHVADLTPHRHCHPRPLQHKTQLSIVR